MKLNHGKKDNEMDSETQEKLKTFVDREILVNCSHLVSELVANDKYTEELMEVCLKYDQDSDDPTEALEHWVVSDWLGKKLQERGEMVIEFMNLTIWGRTCSGQAIFLDSVIEDIHKSL